MLTLMASSGAVPLDIDDYSIIYKYSGLHELELTLPVKHPVYPQLLEEAQVIETTTGQTYLIKAVDGGANDAKIKCQLDVDAWRADMLLGYSNGSATVLQTAEQVCPDGWTVDDRAHISVRRTVEMDGCTPLDVLDACRAPYGVTFGWDTKAKVLAIISPDSYQPVGAFATEQLNLRQLNYKGKSSDFATRLYAYGKDGLSFADINDGKPYVDDHTYSDKVICAAVWRDDRYTVADNLLADAKRLLAAMAVPQRSYECDVVDLASIDPALYGNQDFGLYQVITLIDGPHKARINHQVVEARVYPYYPERNVITLSTVAPSVQSSVKQVQDQITKPTSDFNQQLQAFVEAQTELIAGNLGGNLVILRNPNTGKPYGWAILDTDDAATAKDVWAFTAGGLGHSSHGLNGPFDAVAITQDGKINADTILTGQLIADLIRTGRIQGLQAGGPYIDLDANDGLGEIACSRLVSTSSDVYADIGKEEPQYGTSDGLFIYDSAGKFFQVFLPKDRDYTGLLSLKDLGIEMMLDDGHHWILRAKSGQTSLLVDSVYAIIAKPDKIDFCTNNTVRGTVDTTGYHGDINGNVYDGDGNIRLSIGSGYTGIFGPPTSGAVDTGIRIKPQRIEMVVGNATVGYYDRNGYHNA